VQLLAKILSSLDRERIILSDRDTASKLHKWPPRPIRELPLPQLPLEVGRDSTGLCVASLSRVDPHAFWAQWRAVVKTIEDRRADVVDLKCPAPESASMCKYGFIGTPVLGVSTLTSGLARGRWH
jgi:hypothetical protein